ncbi:MAG: leucyl aminopeptidase family protein [Pseudobdellovibrio sp.]|nr:leucyl aminopeptidase family protein [Pseudobdellovibrio sp.]
MKKNVKKTAPKTKKSFSTILEPHIAYSLVSNFNKLSECDAIIYYFGGKEAKNKQKNLEALVETHALDFQVDELKKSDKKNIHFIGRNGPVWIVFESTGAATDHDGLLNESAYAFARDQFGTILGQIKALKLKNVSIYFQTADAAVTEGAVVGLELASYNFLTHFKASAEKAEPLKIQLNIKNENLESALKKVVAVQIARHLTNLPPNVINPATVEQLVYDLPFSKNTEIIVWDEKKCEAEGMGLLCATGAGSPTAPRMIRFKYRPGKAKNKKPIAFVGKGITFDTGGLDIKPSSAMRLMKKDMGGAASVLALAFWADSSGYDRPCDFYLALAENAVDGFSMRPGDVYKSRAGFLVEIDNTDAEGRLVLSDVMDVAAKQTGSDEPEYLIDIATLTGAIKVALGGDTAGLFCNDDKMAHSFMTAGQRSGEPNWRMPLNQRLWGDLSSQFADFKNSGGGFGGAITAALFLQKFTNGKKWAHLDVYSWTDKSTGALNAGAATGQPVQSVVEWLESL